MDPKIPRDPVRRSKGLDGGEAPEHEADAEGVDELPRHQASEKLAAEPRSLTRGSDTEPRSLAASLGDRVGQVKWSVTKW